MANDIKQKIVLDGEQQYKAALKDAQRELKTLKSELKAETAELGKNATEQEKNAVKVKNLQKQIAEQEKIVKTYTEALKEVKEKYADNEDAISKWEIKLNDARTALANMKNSLADTGTGQPQTLADLNTGVTAAQSFAQAFEGMGSIGESVSGAVEGIFSGIIDTVKQSVQELWQIITETAAKANNWTDLGNYFGSSAEQMQLFSRAIESSGGSFSDFTTLMSQLSFGGKNQKITEWFGVSDANYTNNLEYTMAVLEAMSKAYREWGTGGKWDDAMTAIFGGRRSQMASWFVTNLDTIKEKRDEFEDSGFLMDEEELGTMNEAFIMLKSIEQKWDALKSKFGAGFGLVTLDIMTNVSGALDALADFFNAETPEEREAALEKLRENIEEAFRKIAEAIRAGIEVLNKVAEDLKKSEDPITRTIGNILGGIGSALEWLTEDNMHNAVTALEIMAGFWIAGKGLTMVSTIGKLAGYITTIKTYKGLQSLMGGAAAGNGTGEAMSTAGTAAGGGFTAKLLSGLDTAGGALLTNPATWILGALYGGYKLDQAAYHRDWDKYNENMLESGETLALEGDERTKRLQELYEQLLPATAEAAYGNGEYNPGADDTEGMKNFFREHADEVLAMMPDSEVIKKAAAMELADLSDGLDAGEIERIIAEEGIFGSDWTDLGRELFNKLDDWIKNPESRTDIPADWWKKGTDENGVARAAEESMSAMPANVKEAVRELVGSIVFKMDGEQVAYLLAPRVSQQLAADID